ncbi:MAG: hypothetical protein OZ923_04855 [Comamonadaceae bacterium]|nr:hypothetical protein [Comamonadaceae bacterium]
MRVDSQGYSYKPGQQGILRTVVCKEPDGSERDVTLPSIAAAW